MLPYTFLPHETVGHLGGYPELLCQRKCIAEGHRLQFRGFTVPPPPLPNTHKHTPTSHLRTHGGEAPSTLVMTNPMICVENTLLMLSLLKYGSDRAT